METSVTLANLEEHVDKRAPLVLGRETFSSVTEIVAKPMEMATPKAWWLLFLVSLAGVGVQERQGLPSSGYTNRQGGWSTYQLRCGGSW